MKSIFFLISILFEAQLCAANAGTLGMPCAEEKVQSQRSLELQKIRGADQADREWQAKGVQPIQEMIEKMARNDLERRKRVGEIFGEGCFKSAADYEAAFMVYQHGNTSDQYFQAFVWAKRALAMGMDHVKGDVAWLSIAIWLASDTKNSSALRPFNQSRGVAGASNPSKRAFQIRCVRNIAVGPM